MALQRHQLSPVDGFERQIDWRSLLEQWNQRAIRWILGPGFLSLHLALFGLALLTALTWNLIADPADLRIIGPFRFWGLAALVHTIVLGGGLIGWKLMRMGRPDSPRYIIPMPALVRSRPAAAPTRNWQAAWTRRLDSPAASGAAAGRWPSPPRHQPDPTTPARDSATGWPEIPAFLRAGNNEAETIEASSSDVGEATWPSSAPLSTTLSGSASITPADELVSIDHTDAADTADDHTRTWIDGFIESRTKDKEQRWSWVEAAAGAWLSRREVEGKTEKALTAGDDESGSAPAGPPPDDLNQDHPPSS